MTHPLGAQAGYRRIPLSAEETARGEANFAPFVAQMLVASGRFRVSPTRRTRWSCSRGSPAGWVTCSGGLWSATPTAGRS